MTDVTEETQDDLLLEHQLCFALTVASRSVPGDERTLAVGLTPLGAALRQQATAVPGTMMDRLGLTREQVTQLHAAMMDLIAATKTVPEGPPRR